MWIGPEANTSFFSSAQQQKNTELMMAAASSTEQPKGQTRGMEYPWLIPEPNTMIWPVLLLSSGVVCEDTGLKDPHILRKTVKF